VSDIGDIKSDVASSRISVRLDRKLRSSIKRRAKATGKKEAQLIREALEEEFYVQEPQKTCHDLALKLGLIGAATDTLSDLSTNEKYREGFGDA
jgi:predicted transcriptional regulator